MLNWREIPFVRLLIPFLIGISIAFNWPTKIPFIYSLLIFLSLSLGFLSIKGRGFRHRWWFGAVLNLFLLVFAYQLTLQQDSRFQSAYFGHQLHSQNTYIGVIQNIQAKGERYRLLLQMQSIGDSIQQQTCSGRLLVYMSTDSLTKRLNYGDQLLISSKIRPIEAAKNPASFDFQNYWRQQDIFYQSFIAKRHWQLLARQRGSLILAKAHQTRQWLLAVLEKHLPSTNELAVGAALILGHREHLTDDLKNAYSGTGAMHVLAVSGLHVGLIYLGLAFLLGCIRSKHPYWPLLRTLLLLMGVWSFALITGAAASVLRAATMFSFIILGKAIHHHSNIYNTLAVSAFCLLCWQPSLLMNVGFQLSYLAVMGIVYFQAKIYRCWIIDHPLGDYLWKMSTVALAAQLTTFPISIFYFHQFPVYFWLSGLVVVPAALIILGSGILLFISSALFPFISALLGTVLYWCIWLMNALVFLIQQIPGAVLPGLWLGIGGLILLYLCLLSGIIAINTKQFRWVITAGIFGVLLVGSRTVKQLQQAQQKQMVFYHTRQQWFIDFMDGTHNIALSAKPISPKNTLYIAQNYRWSQGIRSQQALLFDSAPNQTANWFFKDGFVQFYDQKLGIIQGRPQGQAGQKLHLDYLYLCSNAKWSIEELQQHFTFQQVMFAAKAPPKQIQQWTLDCQTKAIAFHNLREQGAFILKL